MDELLDTAPCGYLSFSDDGHVLAVNATLLRMLDRDRHEVVGSHVERILTVSSRIFYQTHFFPLLRLEGRADEIFLTLQSRHGDRVPMIVNAVRRDRGGCIVNECVLIRLHQRQKWEDELLRAKRAAEEANRTKSSFLSMVSHDLRTPLNAIVGYAELIAMGIRGPVTDEQALDLERIMHASRYLEDLLNDVLSLARIEAGQLDMRSEPIELSAALKRAESLVRPQLAEAGLTYEREPHPAIIARGDTERLQQILLNLLGNALKFTPAGGTVRVSCSIDNDCAEVDVSDTGPGIPADHLERIFQPFVQMGGTRGERPRQGAGLGLAISRELARAMGGELAVSSVLGEGAAFSLRLPLDK